jgi:hypothetical protein
MVAKMMDKQFGATRCQRNLRQKALAAKIAKGKQG